MNPQLSALLGAVEGDLAAGLPTGMDEVATRGLVSRVARRRRRRSAARAVVGVAAVTALAVAGWYGVQRVGSRPVEPAVTQGVTSPSESASVAPVTPPAAVDVPGLGELPRATRQTIQAATPGWALVMWGAPDKIGSSSADLLLVSPLGARSLVTTLDLDATVGTGYTLDSNLVDWVAGSTTAQVLLCGPGGGCRLGDLDLLTGRATLWPAAREGDLPDAFLADGSALVDSPTEGLVVVGRDARTALGVEPVLHGALAAVVDPTGTRIAVRSSADRTLRLVDLHGTTTGTVDVPDATCEPMTWSDASHVVLSCAHGTSSRRLVTVGVDDGTVTTATGTVPSDVVTAGLAPDGPLWLVGTHACAGSSGTGCTALWVVADGALSTVTVSAKGTCPQLVSASGSVAWLRQSACGDDSGAGALAAVDASGTVTQVLPEVDGAAGSSVTASVTAVGAGH